MGRVKIHTYSTLARKSESLDLKHKPSIFEMGAPTVKLLKIDFMAA